MCAFCMRRFWSAEDLRRHMRTHSGERPYQCDVCSRRFTLKHSMLRHKRKHGNGANAADINNDSDEEEDIEYMDDEEEGVEIDDDGAQSDEEERTNDSAANKMMRMQAFLKNKLGSDLIGNLLGIQDTSIVEQLMSKPADDAARLLGVGATPAGATHRK